MTSEDNLTHFLLSNLPLRVYELLGNRFLLTYINTTKKGGVHDRDIA